VRAHRWLPLKIVAAGALVGTALVASAPPSSASGCGVSLPGGILSGVAATSSSNAWAVGYYVNSNQVEQTLVLHWNGTAWKRVASPDPGGTSRWNVLSGVAVTSSSNAWAVGYYVNSSYVAQTLVLHWNGIAWKRVSSPDLGTNNELVAVKAISKTNAWAVGYHDTKAYVAQTMIVHWNGTSWTTVSSPNPAGTTYANYLTGITAVSSSNAWAVGHYYTATAAQTLIVHWNGTAWKRVASPDPGGLSYEDNLLYGVAATSSSDAWAVGAYRNASSVYQTLVAHWTGTAWEQVASPDPAVSQHNILNSVAATSSFNAWAVGFTASASTGTGYQTLILHWDGTAWTDVASP